MPKLKPAYLIHGDDHGRIAERRSRLLALAEAQSGPQAIQLLEGEAASPAAVAQAVNALTFALGRRFIVADGAERWKEKDLEPLLAVLANMPPETTVAFFAREDSRAKAPRALPAAVRKAGGDVSAEETVKPWELPKWTISRARELGLELDREAARALVAEVGERQQRLLRELEKLATAHEPDAHLDAAAIDALIASSAERRAWSLADTLLARDLDGAIHLYLTLRAQGERLPGLLYWMSQRVRLAHEAASALEAGEPPAKIKRGLRMPSRAADRLIADARDAGVENLRHAICQIADLELGSRGGGSRIVSEDTAALLALREIALAGTRERVA